MRLHFDIRTQYCNPGWHAEAACLRGGQVDLNGPVCPVVGLGDAIYFAAGDTQGEAVGKVIAYIRMAVAPGVAIATAHRE